MHVVVAEPFRSLLDQYPFKNKWTTRMAQMAFSNYTAWVDFIPHLRIRLAVTFASNKMLNLFFHTNNNFQFSSDEWNIWYQLQSRPHFTMERLMELG